MREVNIDKEKLLKAIKENLTTHEADYQQALKDRDEKAKNDLKAALEQFTSGKGHKVTRIEFPMPQNYTAEYQRVIRMIEMSEDKVLKLSQDEFDRYVLDNWNWKREFAALSASYKV